MRNYFREIVLGSVLLIFFVGLTIRFVTMGAPSGLQIGIAVLILLIGVVALGRQMLKKKQDLQTGTPAEDEAAALRTMNFIIKNRDAITYLNPAIFYMPAFSSESDSLERRKFSESDLSLYVDFTHPKAWNRKSIRRFLDREFKRQPDIASILRRTPITFTSNHAAFFRN